MPVDTAGGRWLFERILLPAAIGLASAWTTVQVLAERVTILQESVKDHEQRLRVVETFAQQDARQLKQEILDAIRAMKEAEGGG